MIRGILVLCAALMTAPVSADPNIGEIIGTIGDLIGGRPGFPGHPGGNPNRPGPGGYGMRCAAYDEGYEEHWSGHASCGECLRQHGRCIEDCEFTEFTCVAEGAAFGRRFQVEGRSWDEYEAQRQAMWECERRGSRYCRLIGPCYQNEQSYRRECRGGGWNRPDPGPDFGRGRGPGRRPGRGRH